MSSVPAALKALNELLTTLQSNPLLLFALVVVAALGVAALALRVAHAALQKK